MNAYVDLEKDLWSHNVKAVMLVQSVILSVLLLVAILYPSFGSHPERNIYPLCVFLLILFAWTILSWRALAGTILDPYIMFMTAAFFFNAGYAFLEVFHLNKQGLFIGHFSQTTIVKTLSLVIIGLVAFHSGALLAAFFTAGRTKPRGAVPDHEQESRPLRLVGWAMIAIAIVPSILYYTQAFATVSSSGYVGIFQQPATSFGTLTIVMSRFMVPGALFLLAGSKGKRLGLVASSSLIFLNSFILFLLGGKSAAIMPLLAYTWLLDHTIRKVPRSVIVVIALLLIIVIVPSISAARGISGQERYSLDSIVNAFKSVEDPALATIAEMGGSMQTICYTIDLVPKTRDYDMGASYYYSFLTVVPNLFWSSHLISSGDRLPSTWLIKTVSPIDAARGGGLGYSFIAEAYLNWGWWGSAVFLGIMGILFGSLVIWGGRSGDLAASAMIASFLSFFLFFARAQSADVVRALLWYSLMPYLAVRYLRHVNLARVTGSYNSARRAPL